MNKHTFGNSFIVVFIVSITFCAWGACSCSWGGRAPQGPPLATGLAEDIVEATAASLRHLDTEVFIGAF